MFAELLKRRIPHILGMYVAAVWLCVEIADWMSERFPVSESLSSYVFVILLSLAPAVAVLAWGHGKPGKDQWTKGQFVVVILNVFLALCAAWYWVALPQNNLPVPPTTPKQAQLAVTETVMVEDETSGESVAYEVPVKGMSQKVSLSFMPNETGDESLDWMQYGASWLLSKDLNRTPLIAVETPFNSENMKLSLQDKGYDQAINEPLALSLQVAQSRSAQWLVRGSIIEESKQPAFKAEMYDVLTGALVKTVTHQHANWLVALDNISSELSELILADHPTIQQQIPDLSIKDHISSDIGAIKEVVAALHAVAFENDYLKAKAALHNAIAADSTLAEAYMLQMKMHVNSGEFQQAANLARKALNLDHKLYGEDVFEVKAQLYGITGEEDKALRVLENWTKVYPESIRAWLSLGNNLLVKGNRLDDAAAAFEQLRDIEPGSKHLLRLSNVHVLRADFEAAVQVLNAYLKHQPESVSAVLALGKVYMRQGQFEQARTQFESAELMVNDDISPELELAKLNMLIGDLTQVESDLLSLLDRANNDNEKLAVYLVLEALYSQRGQMTKSMQINESSAPVAQASMSPIAFLLTYNGKKMGYLSALGQQKASLALLDALYKKTEPPFNQMLVYMRLSYHSTQNDKAGLEKYLEEAKSVMKAFKMSVYQQFLYNYEAMIKRLNGDYDEALHFHDLAIQESTQSIITFNTIEVLIELTRQKVKTLVAKADYESALSILDDMQVYSPRSAENMLLRVEVLQLMGRTAAMEQALAQLEDMWQEADPEYIEYQKFLQLKSNLP